MKKVYLMVILIAGFIVNCATPPPVRKSNVPIGGIGISISLYAPVALMGGKTPEVVYFVKIKEGDAYSQKDLIASNYSRGDFHYLLNVPPGKYAAVAAFYKVGGFGGKNTSEPGSGVTVSVAPGPTDYTTFFSKEIIKLTQIEVMKNRLAYMGKYEIKMSLETNKSDEAQLNYIKLLRPSIVKEGNKIFSGKYSYIGSKQKYSKDSNALKDFFSDSLDYFKGSSWSEVIKKSM